jgi:hypothetical protein
MNVWDEPKGAGCERERDDKPRGNPGGERPISGEPVAGKTCTAGSEGGVRKRTVKVARLAPTLPVHR